MVWLVGVSKGGRWHLVDGRWKYIKDGEAEVEIEETEEEPEPVQVPSAKEKLRYQRLEERHEYAAGKVVKWSDRKERYRFDMDEMEAKYPGYDWDA